MVFETKAPPNVAMPVSSEASSTLSAPSTVVVLPDALILTAPPPIATSPVVVAKTFCAFPVVAESKSPPNVEVVATSNAPRVTTLPPPPIVIALVAVVTAANIFLASLASARILPPNFTSPVSSEA